MKNKHLNLRTNFLKKKVAEEIRAPKPISDLVNVSLKEISFKFNQEAQKCFVLEINNLLFALNATNIEYEMYNHSLETFTPKNISFKFTYNNISARIEFSLSGNTCYVYTGILLTHLLGAAKSTKRLLKLLNEKA